MNKIYDKIFYCVLLCLLGSCIPKPETNKLTIEGMVWIPGGVYDQGASHNDKMALPHEKPKHSVRVDGFYMDITEVTNAQFSRFVK
ncbi:MAG: sulfatase modifying factor 1, partial [Glaciecola sp.]